MKYKTQVAKGYIFTYIATKNISYIKEALKADYAYTIFSAIEYGFYWTIAENMLYWND